MATTPGPYSVSPYSTSLPDPPPIDLHSKHHAESPPHNSATLRGDIHNVAYGSSRMLQQVLGLQPPEPYVRPPQMPQDLEQRFLAGLQEYGHDLKLPGVSPLKALSQTFSMRGMPIRPNLGKAILENIKEDKESPIIATFKVTGTCDAPVGLTINPPMWPLGLQAVAGKDAPLINSKQGLGHISVKAVSLATKQLLTQLNDCLSLITSTPAKQTLVKTTSSPIRMLALVLAPLLPTANRPNPEARQ
jgi:hypothetical protein